MEKKLFATPEYATGEEIKEVRKQLRLTQKEFAQLIGCSKPTIERWERSEDSITGPVALLLKMLKNYPDYVSKMKLPEKTYPLRLYYMHHHTICTVIDVNELERKVKIYNYTDHILFRAFGIEENPDYKQYLKFLESRCFPRSRDKMKLILKDLDLPFYDPFMIIQKTEGKMAEDDFWIKIER